MQKQDFRWLKEHLAELYAEYGVCYLAIKNQKVLGSYKSLGEGVRETAKREPMGTFIVQECGPDESVYTARITSIVV